MTYPCTPRTDSKGNGPARSALKGILIAALITYIGPAQAQSDSHPKEILKRLADMAPDAPAPQPDEFVHVPPTMDDLDASDMHPKLKEAIHRGHDLFVNTQQLRGKNVFNSMNCVSCHVGDGRTPFASPIWPAAVVLPNYRPKNDHVNSLEERIAGCFTYSMNGKPPAYGSDDMLALAAYHQWLAKGVPIYQSGKSMYGRGYPAVADPEHEPDAIRGQDVYKAQCALCHGANGEGTVARGEVVFPPLWGDQSYNWGAGMSRVPSLAAFTKHNMPFGKPRSLSDQDAWDVAQYINSRERPQDPRYTGDVRETRELYLDTFHKTTLYGTEVDGHLLGDHDNTGEKDFLKPDVLRPRSFAPDSDG